VGTARARRSTRLSSGAAAPRPAALLVRQGRFALLEEIMRLFGHNCAAKAFQLLWEHRLMSVLLPEVNAYVERTGGSRPRGSRTHPSTQA